MQGPPGVGKSHLLVSLGVRAIQLGLPVQYFRFDALLTALAADAHVPVARQSGSEHLTLIVALHCNLRGVTCTARKQGWSVIEALMKPSDQLIAEMRLG